MKKVDIDSIYRILEREVKRFKAPFIDLVKIKTKDPFKVLVATILSARTNDIQTTVAAEKLFSKVKDADDLKRLSITQIERLIFPVGFYRNKARFLKNLPEALEKEFDGKIPQTVEELLRLPGVGRKTANLVVVIGFNKPAVCVDTHVHRIMNRFGYVKTKDPFETEMALRKKLPKRYWLRINSVLVAFGQDTCRPISPKCSACPVKRYCNRVGVRTSR